MRSPIRIIATTDLHGLFYDGQYTPRPAGTLAGVREFVSEALISEPSTPTFMVDAGDFAGGGIAVWDGVYLHDGSPDLIAGELSSPMLYDAMVPGNHDLDPGLERFIRYARGIRTPMVGANMVCSAVRPYTYTRRGGVTVGFVGYITTEAAPPDGSFSVEAGSGSVAVAVGKLRSEIDPDHIVLLAHAGPEECRQIMEEVEGIDLAVCGHEHATKGVHRSLDGRLIVNPGPYGLTLADIRVTDGKAEAEIVALQRIPHPMPLHLCRLGGQTLIGGEFPKSLDAHIHRVLGSLGADISVISPTSVTLTEPLSVAESFALLPYDDRLVTFVTAPAELHVAAEGLSMDIHRTPSVEGLAKTVTTVHAYTLMGRPGRIIGVSDQPLRSYLLEFNAE